MNDESIFTMVFPPEAPCGCENGKAFGDCHLVDGSVRISYKDLNPPSPPTYKSIKKCHLAFTNNCDGGISREHIVSRAVLREITDKLITIEAKGIRRTVSIDSSSLTTKRLCKRHNSAVNGLDKEAGRFIRAIRRANSSLAGEIETNQLVTFFHGFDLERWLLKTLLNIYHSGLSGNRTQVELPSGINDRLWNTLPSPFGLYLRVKENAGDFFEMTIERNASFHLMMEGNTVIGVSVTLAGVELKLVVTGNLPYTLDFQETHVFRPKTINFFQGREVVSIMFVWIDGSPHDIWISRGDKTASHPTGAGGLVEGI